MRAQTRRPSRSPRLRADDAGGAATGVVVAVLILAGVAVAGFLYLGGEADVDIKKPDVQVTSSETPG